MAKKDRFFLNFWHLFPTFFFLLFFCFFHSLSLSHEEFSLFHRPDERQKIESLRLQETNMDVVKRDKIYLSGLLYEGPQKWRLWVNGRPFKANIFPDLKVVAVTPTTATFEIIHKGAFFAFTLKLNQHYCLQKHKIAYNYNYSYNYSYR